jgi:hypothetical protein
MKMYFVNKSTGRRYEIVSFDKEAGTVTLKGETATFTEPYDKARIMKNGYKLEKVEDEDA